MVLVNSEITAQNKRFKCELCLNTFERIRSTKRFCSGNCKTFAHRRNKKAVKSPAIVRIIPLVSVTLLQEPKNEL